MPSPWLLFVASVIVHSYKNSYAKIDKTRTLPPDESHSHRLVAQVFVLAANTADSADRLLTVLWQHVDSMR